MSHLVDFKQKFYTGVKVFVNQENQTHVGATRLQSLSCANSSVFCPLQTNVRLFSPQKRYCFSVSAHERFDGAILLSMQCCRSNKFEVFTIVGGEDRSECLSIQHVVFTWRNPHVVIALLHQLPVDQLFTRLQNDNDTQVSRGYSGC